MDDNANLFLLKKTKRKEEKDETLEQNNNKKKTLDIKEKITSIQSIKSYKEEKMKKWKEINKEDLNFNALKQFVNEVYDIHNDSQKLYMEYLIENNKAEFITHYSKYQFVLNLDIREEFQSKIQDDEQLMKILMIRNNFIPD